MLEPRQRLQRVWQLPSLAAVASDAGTRWVPIVRQLVVHLEAQRERTGGEGTCSPRTTPPSSPPVCCGDG